MAGTSPVPEPHRPTALHGEAAPIHSPSGGKVAR